MNEYDDILNRIVEEFYDTGRLVLNESLYSDTLDVFHNLKNNPKTIDEILELYNKLFDYNKEFINKEYVNADETYGIQIEDFINAITDIKNNLINLPRDINTLKSLLSRIDTIKEDGVNFTEEEIGEINKKIGNLEYKEKKKETDKIRGSGEVTTIQTPERAKESRQSEIKETNTNLKLGSCHLVWFNEENPNYKVINCEDYSTHVDNMFELLINEREQFIQ